MADSPAHDSTRTVSYVSDPIGRAFGLAIVVGVASVPLIAITIAIVHLGDVRGMWGLLLFGVLLLVAVMVLYWMERRYSSEGIDLRKIDALENIELARVEGDTSVQLVHARAVLREAKNRRQQIEQAADAVRSQPAPSPLSELSTFVPPYAPRAAATGSPWSTPEPGGLQPLRQDETVNVMLRWAESVHRHIERDGKIRVSVPWSERGELPGKEKARALGWLQAAANMQGARWCVSHHPDQRAWYLNVEDFPDGTALLNALAATPPPRNE